ncbi:MAG: prolipoprotein diacylglyceryl transferase [Sandaracinaceae bacterium]|jgi:phosphatidylglycerol:prolipoprotein diacylglycerol transferase|nr:prolipoprotein diacylglyceryl transferase [Sandaracinaceae bacterium]MBK7156760.1 prolipoprotein diacylglyceryl transferase [Sandaracinaceae bacterium]MBK7777573.1 prolipoprotein diacylglyceryl transferase [Sandaracinaceae bacterium]MBK8410020.1 prolipoprotein diacylglyceryl transferase [Sandaracinaceae bacterium]MBP7685894.1 prolipoprotein diacylglyceryl transferase [Deltaproteobacteria bacterium]
MPFHWNPDPIIAELGSIELRWYGVCFAIGILWGATMLPRYYQQRGFSEDHANSLSIWIPLCMIIGAHAVHIIFYDTEVLTRFWRTPDWDHFRPILDVRSGLASHGGGLGCIFAVWAYARSKKLSFFELVDATMLAAVWVFPWVRIGNFVNSEILGMPATVPWAVVFDQIDQTPRHPTQLYEATLGFVLIGIAVWLNRKHAHRLRPGALFFTLLGLYFVLRFIVEFWKEHQTPDPMSAYITTGQWLSLPIFLTCGLVLLLSKRHGILTPPDADQRWWERAAPAAPPPAEGAADNA